MDAYDEIQILCAAHEFGLTLERCTDGAWLVSDEDVRESYTFRDRAGALAWLSAHVFRALPFGSIGWDSENT